METSGAAARLPAPAPEWRNGSNRHRRHIFPGLCQWPGTTAATMSPFCLKYDVHEDAMVRGVFAISPVNPSMGSARRRAGRVAGNSNRNRRAKAR